MSNNRYTITRARVNTGNPEDLIGEWTVTHESGWRITWIEDTETADVFTPNGQHAGASELIIYAPESPEGFPDLPPMPDAPDLMLRETLENYITENAYDLGFPDLDEFYGTNQ